ncbi:unnamed protein product, partial [Ectocarpus sp. 12 AP-2014]
MARRGQHDSMAPERSCRKATVAFKSNMRAYLNQIPKQIRAPAPKVSLPPIEGCSIFMDSRQWADTYHTRRQPAPAHSRQVPSFATTKCCRSNEKNFIVGVGSRPASLGPCSSTHTNMIV